MADGVKIDNEARKVKYYAPNPDRREQIGRFLSKLGKFAIDSAVGDSLLQLKGAVIGKKKAHKMVQEEWEHRPCSPSLNDKKREGDLKLAKEMRAKMEEKLEEEEMNVVKPQIKTSPKSAESSEPLKEIPNEGFRGLDQMQSNEKKVYIRSRL